MAAVEHIPVLLDQVLDGLQVMPGGTYCDATVGYGGHTTKILEQSAPGGRVAGLDQDMDAIDACRASLSRFGDRITLCHANFSDLVDVLTRLGMVPVDGLLVDLGVSSFQLGVPERGFSLGSDGPLDMRMNQRAGVTAGDLIARLTERELSRLIRKYGEEPASKRIARAIKEAHGRGELSGTAALAAVVSSVLQERQHGKGRRIHPATRTFMALRMVVNDELGSLERFLDTFTEALRPGGRVAVISFHSLEDRIVKHRLAALADPCTCPPDLPFCGCGKKPSVAVLTRRPLRPDAREVSDNPRARSAKLRVAERLP